jgi:hypothetical protein
MIGGPEFNTFMSIFVQNETQTEEEKMFSLIDQSSVEEVSNDLIHYIKESESNLNDSHIKKAKYFDSIYLKNLLLIYKNDENISKKDKKQNNQLEKFKDITLQHLEVKKRFRLNEPKNQPYQNSISIFKNIDMVHTSEEKVDIIINTIGGITNEVKSFYENDNSIKEGDLVVGAGSFIFKTKMICFQFLLISSLNQVLETFTPSCNFLWTLQTKIYYEEAQGIPLLLWKLL